MNLRVGCAGWKIPKLYQEWFPTPGSHLDRYAVRFSAVEINSTFYKTHRSSTFVQWAQAVPDDFRFSVKLTREITHQGMLVHLEMLESFLENVRALGERLGPILVQLPPRLAFEPNVAENFFKKLREQFSGPVVCEPRNPGWFTPEAQALLVDYQVARAAVDPVPVAGGARPGGWRGFVYYRLHGSPRMYYSSYTASYLYELAQKLEARSRTAPVWCIFDNTASSAALDNALILLERLHQLNK